MQDGSMGIFVSIFQKACLARTLFRTILDWIWGGWYILLVCGSCSWGLGRVVVLYGVLTLAYGIVLDGYTFSSSFVWILVMFFLIYLWLCFCPSPTFLSAHVVWVTLDELLPTSPFSLVFLSNFVSRVSETGRPFKSFISEDGVFWREEDHSNHSSQRME